MYNLKLERMKKNLLFLFLTFMTLGFVACDDEDKKIDDPQDGAISLVWETNPDFDTVEIFQKTEVDALIAINAEAGIKSLQLKITSPALTAEILGTVGLAPEVDLVTLDLDEDFAAILNGVPFGEQVKDQTSVRFDVSSLVPMIMNLPNSVGNHVFSIKVTDNKNHTQSCDLVFYYDGLPELSILWKTNANFDTLEIVPDMTGQAVVDIVAEVGIKSLQLNIQSAALNEQLLNEVGLSTSIDFTNELNDQQVALLPNLPYGSAVKDQMEVTFDVSALVPMIIPLPNHDGLHVFDLKVTDNNDNSISRSLVFHYQEPADLSVSAINLWANTAIVTAKGLGTNGKVQYREQGTDVWQDVTDNGDGTFTIAPVWNEAKNDAGLTIYTPAEGTGVWAGKTYEYQITDGKEEILLSTFETETGDTIPNGDMSAWSEIERGGLMTANVPYPNAAGQNFWDSGNNSFTDALCTKDANLNCAKLASTNMIVLASGNLFTGNFVMSMMTGTVNFGQPYTYSARPTALKLRYHATIGNVDMTAAPAVEGIPAKIEIDKPDAAVIYVAIVDWSEQHQVTSGMAGANTGKGSWNPATMEGLDAEKEKVIAYGLYDITSSTDGEDLIDLTIPLNFYDKDAVAPTGNYTLVISCSCSKYGDYLNGCSSNVMYVDDFQWVY